MEVSTKKTISKMITFYSMGAKIKTIDKRFAPSPSAYEIDQHVIGRHSYKYGFGT